MNLSRFCAALTPAQALSPENKQLSVLKKEDETHYLKVVALLLTRCRELLNIKPENSLSVMQTVDLAYRIGKDYYYLRLEEILYVIQQATSGRYGKDYNRLDAATVMGWLERYDVEERTPLVVNRSQQPVVESAQPLNDEELDKFYQRVAAGEKTDVPANRRVSDDFRDAQNAARLRYVSEKAEGIVQDYSKEDVQRMSAKHMAEEFDSQKEGVQRLVDGEYEDVTDTAE
ncbi:MAG: hypothetical protein JWP57_730 [Spirosoma sp.]|nr:hypothetical protein [Spirosoma sp.]